MIEFVFALMVATQPVTTYKEVPEPIPYDFNQCVRVFWTDKGRENGIKYRASKWEPPLEPGLPAYLEYYRREGWGKLVLCDDKPA